MKKITMLVAFLFAFIAEGYAQFPQGFEGATFPPVGWTSFIGTNGLGTTQNWQTNGLFVNGGANAAYVRYDNTDPGQVKEDWLVTPQVTITAGAPALKFYETQQYTAVYNSVYTIRVSTTSQTNIASFTTVSTETETDLSIGAMQSKMVDLSAYIGQSVYIAFVMANDDGDNWFIDDVSFGSLVSLPDCASNPTPADAAVDVPVGTVTFSWTAPTTGGTPDSYDIYYGTTAADVTNFVGNFTTTSADIVLSGYNTTLYWKVVPRNTGGSATGCAVWSFTTASPPPVPANDACSTAIAVTTFPYNNSQDAFSATNNAGFITSCTDVAGMNDGVWYAVTGNGFDLTVTVDNVVGWDPQLDVYTGSCGTFTCLASADAGGADAGETVMIPASVLGTTYYINIGQYSDTTDNPEGPFSIHVISATNDTPDFANLQYPAAATITESGSTIVYGQVYEGGLTDVEPGLSGQAAGIEMWVGVSPDNTNPNTWDETSWTSGTWNALFDTTSNNDEYMLTIGADLAPGTYYYATRWRLNNGPYVYGGILADGQGNIWDGTTYNSGVLTINPAPAPANDACSGAIALTPGGIFDDNDLTTTSAGATVDAADVVPACGNFNFATADKDVWYSVAVPASGSITIETSGTGTLADTALEVYSGTCGSLTAIDCNDDIDYPDNTYSSLALTGRTPGEILLIRVWGYNGTSGTFRVSAFDASLGTQQFGNGGFSVYPNPVKNVLNLAGTQDISDVAVYNLLGQQVAAKPINASQGQIDMSALSQGTYIVKVTANHQVQTIKVIKE